jgi:acyl carrier protein
MEIERKLTEIVRAHQGPAAGELTRATLLAEAGIDSLDSLSVIFAVEETFDISIPEERARGVKTFGDMIDLVAALVPSAP